MAEMATYVGIEPRSINLNAAVNRGLRVSINSSGTYDVQDATAVGDFVLIEDGEAAKPVLAASVAGGGKVPALAVVQVAIGDTAYSATGGKFTNVSTSATLMGKFTQATGGANALTEVELGV
jgi:hypothetical protein